MVESVLNDVDTAPLSAKDRALFQFVERVNTDSSSLTPAVVDEVRKAGWDDEAIYDAITVCALFNFYNRWIDASGVHAMPDEAHRAGAEQLRKGYLAG